MTSPLKIGITTGDPAGIGPEIVLKALDRLKRDSTWIPVVFGDIAVLNQAKELTGNKIRFKKYDNQITDAVDEGEVLYVSSGIIKDAVTYGIVDIDYGRASLINIENAVDMAMSRKLDVIVTAPINKQSLMRTGAGYLDHSSIFKDRCGVEEIDTMFLTGRLKIFFMTKHVSLKDVSYILNKDFVLKSIRRCMKYLVSFGIAKPTLAVAAFNPHAGDNGLLGREEIDVLRPAIRQAQQELLDVRGPVPADSVFHFANEGMFDGVLSLYHDQGHIAAKTLDFYRTVSFTLGLPFLRVSVDHGTAFDIAGKGVASSEGMVAAIQAGLKYGRNLSSMYTG